MNLLLIKYSVFLILITILVVPVGRYLHRIFFPAPQNSISLRRKIESKIYKLLGVDEHHDMTWSEYFWAFFGLGMAGSALLFVLLMLQHLLPFFQLTHEFLTTPMSWDLALNTAFSFSTTTTWQSYGGENTMTYFSQMAGFAAQNFVAGAAGLAVGVAFIRGLARQEKPGIGNFWVDFIRSIMWVLLPASFLGSLLLLWQGVPMNFMGYVHAQTLQGAEQIIAQGPVAALEAIKNLGSNGGGFFNVNGAHPYENPTPLSNLLEMLMIAVIPAALTYTYGKAVNNKRHGWALFVVMAILFATGLGICSWAEMHANPSQAASLHIEKQGNWEGKETRFGIGDSVLDAVTTSNGATGSYNSMHDSYTPIGGLVPLFNMLLGEVAFGGLGSGLYSLIFVVLLSAFMAGLMIGRAPQFLQKSLGPPEMKLVVLYLLISSFVILPLTAISVIVPQGLAGISTNGTGPHGLTTILYAFTSAFGTNGQNFAGINSNTPFFNLTLIIAMLAGRFGLAYPVLHVAGMFAEKKSRGVDSNGMLNESSVMMNIFVIGILLVSVGLSFFPVLCVGPIVEHLL